MDLESEKDEESYGGHIVQRALAGQAHIERVDMAQACLVMTGSQEDFWGGLGSLANNRKWEEEKVRVGGIKQFFFFFFLGYRPCIR